MWVNVGKYTIHGCHGIENHHLFLVHIIEKWWCSIAMLVLPEFTESIFSACWPEMYQNNQLRYTLDKYCQLFSFGVNFLRCQPPNKNHEILGIISLGLTHLIVEPFSSPKNWMHPLTERNQVLTQPFVEKRKTADVLWKTRGLIDL